MKVKKIIILFMILILMLSFFSLKYEYAIENDISLYAPAVILMDKDSGKILYEKNAYERRFPASTTKLMTAILAVENCNLDDIAKVSYTAIMSVPYGYSNAALKVDEELTINDLLHALLIPSANDAANVIAEHISGSIDSFASMMNTKAVEIGCTNTHFINPSGIHSDDHYSSTYDLCLIAKYASKYDVINEIASKTLYTLPATNKYPNADRILKATNYLLRTDYPNYYYEYATGLKTGYTTEAKDCIIATATKDDKNLLCVILGAESNGEIKGAKFLDCKTLFNYGFDNYTKKVLINQGEIAHTSSISGATLDTRSLGLEAQNGISILVKNENSNIDYTSQVTLKPGISAPISKGDVVGALSYEVDGQNYTTELIAEHDVYKSSFFQILFRILLILLILFIVYSILNNSKKKKYNKKARYITRYR